MEDVMTYLDDQRKAMPEEVYLELGRKLADAKDTLSPNCSLSRGFP